MKVKLEDVCERGSSNLKQSDIIGLKGDYPIYGASGYIGNVNFYHQERPYVAVVKDGAGIGRTTFHPAKSSVIGTMQYLLPKDNVLPEYLCYVVKYMHLEKYFTGATIPHIYFRDYKNEQFNLDSLEKQAEIVDVLGKCERIIADREEELKKLDELIKARFVELFDNCNKEVLIGEVIDICRGASPRPIQSFITDDPEGVNWIKIGDVSENSLYITHTSERITAEGAKKSRAVCKGDFILSNSMSFGRPYILGIDGCVHDGWLILSGFRKVFNELYLYHALRSEYIQNQFSGKVNGATVKNLNSDLVKSTYIKLPDKKEQEDFAYFVEQVDKSKFVA